MRAKLQFLQYGELLSTTKTVRTLSKRIGDFNSNTGIQSLQSSAWQRILLQIILPRAVPVTRSQPLHNQLQQEQESIASIRKSL